MPPGNRSLKEGIRRRDHFISTAQHRGIHLLFTLIRLVPNRKMGRTSTVIAPHVLDAQYVASDLPENGRGDWEIDLDKWTATLVSPETSLGRLTLPLEPMAGMFWCRSATQTGNLHSNLLNTRWEYGLPRFL